ncbi:hypothetical protein Vi05172_g12749 [Venturia inaequalis]|nr:hypothetical protein Vi05172_g12749 [Venturia inaequalis]
MNHWQSMDLIDQYLQTSDRFLQIIQPADIEIPSRSRAPTLENPDSNNLKY